MSQSEIADTPLPVGKEGTRPQKVSAVDSYGRVSPMFDGGKWEEAQLP